MSELDFRVYKLSSLPAKPSKQSFLRLINAKFKMCTFLCLNHQKWVGYVSSYYSLSPDQFKYHVIPTLELKYLALSDSSKFLLLM